MEVSKNLREPTKNLGTNSSDMGEIVGDVSKARTEPFVVFAAAHILLNTSTKITMAAFLALEQTLSNPEISAVQELSRLIDEVGEPWSRAAKYSDPKKAVSSSKEDFARMMVVKVFSYFDDFLVGISSEVMREGQAGGDPIPAVLDKFVESDVATEEDDTALTRFFASNNWPIGTATPLLPLFEYFRIARNCIAHRDGRASEAFVNLDMDLVNSSIQRLNRRKVEMPALPSGGTGGLIVFQAHHVILASECCYRIAAAINSLLVHQIGYAGLLRMAARNAVLIHGHPARVHQVDADGAVANFLSKRYRVTITKTTARRDMASIGIWKEVLRSFAVNAPKTRTKKHNRKQK